MLANFHFHFHFLVSSHCVILCHSVAFVLCAFSFRETENFYVSATERLKQREKTKLNQMLIKICGNVDEKITKKLQQIEELYITAAGPRVSLEGKTESNLKLLKDKILHVNNFFLFDFGLFCDRRKAISKLLFVSTNFPIRNNLKLPTTLMTKPILWKIQVLIHSNDFRTGILF